MSKVLKALLIPFFGLSTAAYAQTETTTTSSAPVATEATTAPTAAAGTTEVQLPDVLKNKKFEENEKITDAKMRADSGSLSKYSLSFSLSYYGPTLGDLSAKDQPNPDGSVGSYETALGGSLGGRYRMSSNETVRVGTGLKVIHPLHGAERTDLNNPYISYALTTKLGAVQMRNTFGGSVITVPNYTKIGEYGSLDYDNSMVYDLGSTKFAVGLDTSVSLYLYNREYRKADGKASTYNLAFYPNFKYNITDKLNVNTSVSISYWNPRANESRWNLQNRTVSQRLGLGYAYTRDIYISPYLNFFPDNLSDKGTTLNFSTSFSIL